MHKNRSSSIGRVVECLFALGIIVLNLIELRRPHRLYAISTHSHQFITHARLTSDCCSEIFALKCSESGPLCPPSVLLSLSDELPTRLTQLAQCHFEGCSEDRSHTRTTLGASSGGVCGVSAASGESVFNVLHALGFVRVREPVLAHVDVVSEAYGAACHEDFRDREGGHGCGGVWCGEGQVVR
jgi:hypothetical protein